MSHIEGELVRFDEQFGISFHRTLRVPDNGQKHLLPPGLGAFPIKRVEEYQERLPESWARSGGVFIPMYQREALWLGFRGAPWKPHAVKVAVGGFNALTGAPHDRELQSDPQDYLVCPPQVWLDGIRTERGTIRQFVAVPLGAGGTVEGGLTGLEIRGGIQITVFCATPGIFPDEAPDAPERHGPMRSLGGGPSMGFGAGGEIVQKLYPDPHGIDTWDAASASELEVHVLNSLEFELATGQPPPPSPIDARSYTEHGLPWFQLYDEASGDLGASPLLRRVKTLAEYQAALGENAAEAPETLGQPPTVHGIRRSKV